MKLTVKSIQGSYWFHQFLPHLLLVRPQSPCHQSHDWRRASAQSHLVGWCLVLPIKNPPNCSVESTSAKTSVTESFTIYEIHTDLMICLLNYHLGFRSLSKLAPCSDQRRCPYPPSQKSSKLEHNLDLDSQAGDVVFRQSEVYHQSFIKFVGYHNIRKKVRDWNFSLLE